MLNSMSSLSGSETIFVAGLILFVVSFTYVVVKLIISSLIEDWAYGDY